MVEWRSIPSLPGYEASDDGRIRSIMRKSRDRWGKPCWRPSHELHLFPRRGGYLGGNVSIDGKRINFDVHRLVAEAFYGPPPPGTQARHLNGIGTDNRAANLCWGTSSENQLDVVRHGHHAEVNRTHCPAGHEYTPENTRVRGGKRACLACNRIRDRARWPARSEARRQKNAHQCS
jgi:hypothetical protein